MVQMKRKITDALLVIWWISMFILTTIPTTNLPGIEVIGLDKVVHFILYGILTALLWRALAQRKYFGSQLMFMVVFTTTLYALFDEIHQPLVGRTCSLFDFSADTLGILFVSTILFIRHRKRAARADRN